MFEKSSLRRVRSFAVRLVRQFLERAKGASGHANTLTVDLDGLQINPLTTSGGDVGVAAGVTVQSGFPRELTDARHTNEEKMAATSSARMAEE